MSQTLRCIECLEPAAIWRGYVLRVKRRVLAGWCAAHGRRSTRRSLLGNRACYGGWHAKYGDTFKRRMRAATVGREQR